MNDRPVPQVTGASIPAPFPAPAPNDHDAPFWDWCRRGQLRLQRCTECGSWRHHPRPRCPRCRSASFSWDPVRGLGVVHSYTFCHPPVLPAFAEHVPYNAAVVRLEEGPFMVTNIVECSDEVITVGLEVEVVMRAVDENLTLPQFRPSNVALRVPRAPAGRPG